MKYINYSSDDLAADVYFRNWVLSPDTDSNTYWQNWLAHHPEKQELISEAKKIVLAFRVEEKEYSDAFIAQLWQNIDTQTSQTPVIRSLPDALQVRKNRFFNQYRKMAAAIAVLLVAAAILITLYPMQEKQTTAFGETKTIMLPDSSEVILNANSRLSYATNWEKREIREVWLEGEAFFHVRKQAGSPASQGLKFIVHTSLVDVEALGTEFNVNTHRGKAQVVLNSGKVKLNSGIAGQASSIYMQPGELVELSEKHAIFTKRLVKPTTYSAWKNKQLIFEQTPLVEIAKILEDTYGWQVTIASEELSSLTFTSTISAEQPEVLLRLLSESFHVNITRKGNQVMIRKTG